MTDKRNQVVLVISFIAILTTTNSAEEATDLATGHPRPSYDNVKNINAMAEAVRKNQFAAHRGAWEWDRLLSRYIDGGREEKNALIILQADVRSSLAPEGKDAS